MAAGGTFVYVSNADSREICVMQLDCTSGELKLIEKTAVGGSVMPMAVSPDRRFLYAVLRTLPYSVASFAIDPMSGKLAHLANAPLPDSIPYITTDRNGRFLLAASYPGNKISVSPIGAQGFVQPPQQIIGTEPKAHCIVCDASNRFVFVPCLGGDLVLQLRLDAATGKLSPNTPASVHVRANAGPRHFALHPNNRFAYLLNELDGSIYAFAYDAGAGTLSEIEIASAVPPDFTGEPKAADLHLTPDGSFLYASVRSSNTLAGFRIDGETGRLSLVGHFATEQQPRGFNIDPYGRHLLCAGQKSHSMSVFAIARETGLLTRLKQYPLGQNPNWIEIVNLP